MQSPSALISEGEVETDGCGMENEPIDSVENVTEYDSGLPAASFVVTEYVPAGICPGIPMGIVVV